jgi:hypothetical protein
MTGAHATCTPPCHENEPAAANGSQYSNFAQIAPAADQRPLASHGRDLPTLAP